MSLQVSKDHTFPVKKTRFREMPLGFCFVTRNKPARCCYPILYLQFSVGEFVLSSSESVSLWATWLTSDADVVRTGPSGVVKGREERWANAWIFNPRNVLVIYLSFRINLIQRIHFISIDFEKLREITKNTLECPRSSKKYYKNFNTLFVIWN